MLEKTAMYEVILHAIQYLLNFNYKFDVMTALFLLITVGGSQTGMSIDQSTNTFTVLQLMVYTAAETNAQQFIQVLFSTSVGKAVFSHYRDNTRLPHHVAQDNGHKELAEYLDKLHHRWVVIRSAIICLFLLIYVLFTHFA